MSRQRHLGDRETSWRALVLAVGVAAGVMLLLLASIGVIWFVGRSSPSAPALGAQPPPTPTPRSLAFLQETPDPSAPTQEQPGAALPSVPSTPSLLAMPTGAQSNAPGDALSFSAPDNHPFASFASGSWTATEDVLRNNGKSADAEPWLTLATVPGAAFAVEAEIRVDGLLDTFCDQSFGLAVGDADAVQVFGAGILFPCQDGLARARLTDVSIWEDGYHADPLIAENPFDPGADWRTYRFEVRGDAVRLIVDGRGILTGTLDTPIAAAGGAEAGVWSQGVALEIRRIEISPLPGS